MAKLKPFYEMKYKTNSRFRVFLQVIKAGTVNLNLAELTDLSHLAKSISLPNFESGELKLEFGNSAQRFIIPKYGNKELSISFYEDNSETFARQFIPLFRSALAYNVTKTDIAYVPERKRTKLKIIVEEISTDMTKVLARHIFEDCKLTSNSSLQLNYMASDVQIYDLSFAYFRYTIEYPNMK